MKYNYLGSLSEYRSKISLSFNLTKDWLCKDEQNQSMKNFINRLDLIKFRSKEKDFWTKRKQQFVSMVWRVDVICFNLWCFFIITGTPINRLPIMAKQVLDLYELYNLVLARGGLVEVINKKQWQEVIKGLGLPSSITSAAFTLRTQ